MKRAVFEEVRSKAIVARFTHPAEDRPPLTVENPLWLIEVLRIRAERHAEHNGRSENFRIFGRQNQCTVSAHGIAHHGTLRSFLTDAEFRFNGWHQFVDQHIHVGISPAIFINPVGVETLRHHIDHRTRFAGILIGIIADIAPLVPGFFIVTKAMEQIDYRVGILAMFVFRWQQHGIVNGPVQQTALYRQILAQTLKRQRSPVVRLLLFAAGKDCKHQKYRQQN